MLSGLGLSAVCAAGALTAAVGIVAMAFHGRPRPWAAHLLRRAAGTAAWAAAIVYSLGFLSVLLSEQAFGDGADSIPALAAALLVIGAGHASEFRARKKTAVVS